jgi:anion-transporting  ArsA/GET3 family ATPase
VTIENRPIEIFCGTGGVGKTTLATSRAFDLASKGNKTLLITIDPARRLKQILKLNDDHAGIVSQVNSQDIFKDSKDSYSLDALLLSPEVTLKRVLLGQHNLDKDLDNRILDILTRPHGGLNEIMAIIEVQHQLNTGLYDSVILDTPPGKHFIDFLNATQKINAFFDKSFVEIFNYLGKNIGDEKSGNKLFGSIMASGVKKLLKYLEKVTGEDFIEVFIDAVITLYKNKDVFTQALNFEEKLKDSESSNWFLVTSVEQHKLKQAAELKQSAIDFMHSNTYLTINKCIPEDFRAWEPDVSSSLNKLKNTMLERENRLKEFAKNNFTTVLCFHEVLSTTPAEHVGELSKEWTF